MKKILILLLSLALLQGCTAKEASTTVSERKNYSNITVTAGFDTYISMQAVCDSQEEFTTYFDQGVSLFKEMNELFDIYNSYTGVNNLKTINDSAGIEPVKVDENIIEMLQYAKDFYELSEGEFDVTMGAVLKVWHKYRENGTSLQEEGKYGPIPSMEELEEAKACTGWENIEINTDESTVFITNPCVSLDVGGIAKGFAAEKVAQYLESQGVTTGIVDAGGNNRTIGTKLDGTPWNAGIQNPEGDGSIIAVKSSGDSSFVTSGDYQRYYIADDGNRYAHIIDPQTLFPPTDFRSVSIITKNSAVADALSTTLFTLSYEEGLSFIDAYRSTHPDIELNAIWIMDKEKATDSMPGKVVGDFFIAHTEELTDRITWK